MEPTLHSQNCVPVKGLDLPRGRTFPHGGQREMAEQDVWSENGNSQTHTTAP